jgi:hypothetical protein
MLREDLIKPYVLKAVPCILVWCKVIYDMLVLRADPLFERVASKGARVEVLGTGPGSV